MLKKIWRYAERPVLAALCYLLFYGTTTLMTFLFSGGELFREPQYEMIPTVTRALFFPFVFFSFVRVLAEQDGPWDKSYLKSAKTAPVRQDMRQIFAQRPFLWEGLVFLLLVLRLPLGRCFGITADLFFGKASPPLAQKPLFLLLLVPFLFALWVLARLSAMQTRRERVWRERVFADDADVRHAPNRYLRLARNAVGTAVLYLAGAFCLSFALPILVTAVRIVQVITEARWWGLPLLILAILTVFFVRHAVRGVLIRRRLLKNLQRLCREQGFQMQGKRRIYRSLFFLRDEVNFTVLANGKRYDCKLFCSLRRHCPLYFQENGTVLCQHSLRFRRVEFFRFCTSYHFDFKSDAIKVCIVAPVPKELFAGDTVRNRPIDTGVAVGDYHIFNSTGFLGALLRDCVEIS